MINLCEYLTEGILDVDKNIDNVEIIALVKKWIDEQSKMDNYYVKNTKWEIRRDGSISPLGNACVKGNVPKYIKIVGDISPQFMNCNIECLDSIQCDVLKLSNVTIEDFGKGFQGESVDIQLCNNINDLDWLPKKLDILKITSCSFKKFDISHVTTRNYLEISGINVENIKNIKSNGDIYIKYCHNLKTVENIECDTFSMRDCIRFEQFVGNNKVKTLGSCIGCKQFKPINLPKTLEELYCNRMSKEWTETNVMALNPDLKLKRAKFRKVK